MLQEVLEDGPSWENKLDPRRLSRADAAVLCATSNPYGTAPARHGETPCSRLELLSPERQKQWLQTPPKKKAKELAKLLRAEQPNYPYLKSVFRALRAELEIAVPRKEARLPDIPTEDDIRHFYQAVWNW